MPTLFLSLLSFNLLALEISFVGPCSETPMYSTVTSSDEVNDVGSLSLLVLQEVGIPFKGTIEGLNQIFDTPIGLEAMEVISDREMMAYRWCYEVDGVMPEVFPNEVSIESVKKIKWFYGYAHYLNGEWVAQCLKSYKRQPRFICKH